MWKYLNPVPCEQIKLFTDILIMYIQIKKLFLKNNILYPIYVNKQDNNVRINIQISDFLKHIWFYNFICGEKNYPPPPFSHHQSIVVILIEAKWLSILMSIPEKFWVYSTTDNSSSVYQFVYIHVHTYTCIKVMNPNDLSRNSVKGRDIYTHLRLEGKSITETKLITQFLQQRA